MDYDFVGSVTSVCRQIGFQSLIGRLKTFACLSPIKSVTVFQSLIGRLKTARALLPAPRPPSFNPS